MIIDEMIKRRAELDGIILILNDYQGNCSMTFDKELNPALGLLTSHILHNEKIEARKKNIDLFSGVPLQSQGAFYHLIPSGGELIDPARYESMKKGWEVARGLRLSEPVWEAGVGWEPEKPDYLPYSTLLKFLRLGDDVFRSSSTTFNALLEAQSNKSIEELLQSPNVKTGTWLDDPFPSCPEENPEVDEPYPYRNPPKPKGRDGLEIVEEVIDQTGRYIYSYDKNDLLIADCNRRDDMLMLKANGLYPIPRGEKGLEKVTRLNLEKVRGLIAAMERLNHYAASEERRHWNPDAQPTDTLADTPVAYDWFLYQRLPSDWDAFDALARLERIFRDEHSTSAGFIYTKLFGLRLRMVVREELDDRLIISAVDQVEL